jgi:monovalent cation:H+ antiporter-2, CPA2 family
MLIPRGEFSIVIAGLGVAAGVEPDLGPLAAAYVLILALFGSVIARTERLPRWLDRSVRHRQPWSRPSTAAGPPS